MSDQPLPRCPQCAGILQQVRYKEHSYLNREQWDSVRAGDYYCDTCTSNVAQSGYKYWWLRELADPKLKAERPETALRARIAELEKRNAEDIKWGQRHKDQSIQIAIESGQRLKLIGSLEAERDTLKARVGELERDMEAWKEEAGTFEEQAADLKAERDRLRDETSRQEWLVENKRLWEALEWYADEENWRWRTRIEGGSLIGMRPFVLDDNGQRARQAIGKEAP